MGVVAEAASALSQRRPALRGLPARPAAAEERGGGHVGPGGGMVSAALPALLPAPLRSATGFVGFGWGALPVRRYRRRPASAGGCPVPPGRVGGAARLSRGCAPSAPSESVGKIITRMAGCCLFGFFFFLETPNMLARNVNSNPLRLDLIFNRSFVDLGADD